jgi:hypothetical protein
VGIGVIPNLDPLTQLAYPTSKYKLDLLGNMRLLTGSGNTTNNIVLKTGVGGAPRIGIGTENPARALHVVTDHFNTPTGPPDGLRLEETTKFKTGGKKSLVWDIVPQSGQLVIGLGEYTNPNTLNKMIVLDQDGSVGIGTTLSSNPGYKLAVAGVIAAKEEIIVENTSATWPDYVFESSNVRMDYVEKEIFFKEQKHLPGIDSAKEIQQNGLKFVKTLAGVTQNVEENSLDIIELSKQNAELKREMENLKKELEMIKKK